MLSALLSAVLGESSIGDTSPVAGNASQETRDASLAADVPIHHRRCCLVFISFREDCSWFLKENPGDFVLIAIFLTPLREKKRSEIENHVVI